MIAASLGESGRRVLALSPCVAPIRLTPAGDVELQIRKSNLDSGRKTYSVYPVEFGRLAANIVCPKTSKIIVEIIAIWHNRAAFVALVYLSSCTQRLRGFERDRLCFSALEVKQRIDGAIYQKE